MTDETWLDLFNAEEMYSTWHDLFNHISLEFEMQSPISRFMDGHILICDLGLIYGYCFQPQRFSTPDAGVTGTTWWLEDGTQIPLFSNREDAVEYIRQMGFYGNVQRYCKDKEGNRSWVTAGVTDIVNAPPDGPVHMHLMGNHDLKIHRRKDQAA